MAAAATASSDNHNGHGDGDHAMRKAKKTMYSNEFSPQPDWTLISQGAEARLYKIPKYFSENAALAKQRFSKSYRHPTLDERLTKQRCKAEAKCILKCRRAGIPCPALYGVHPPVLYMEFINGSTVRDYIEGTSNETKLTELATNMGNLIGRVHNAGVVHGDLTTSNIMLTENGDLVLIDFGLAKVASSSINPEEAAVDLYVLERALLSTHPKLEGTDFLDALLASYKATCKRSDAVFHKLGQVRMRGRKRECFG